ncbi:MAG: alpha-glucosidase C-terminal domain-containing protein, partial [Oscillospiraceae bacterium]|nr:alpha-glucosidase C-terminal domain-containing protein [Oscillospiraceae bacterium]
QEHAALQSKGEIEFVYAEKDSYPLAYIRSTADEKILVIINPAAREVSFDCSIIPTETIYGFGGTVSFADSKVTVAPQSAGYYRI